MNVYSAGDGEAIHDYLAGLSPSEFRRLKVGASLTAIGSGLVGACTLLPRAAADFLGTPNALQVAEVWIGTGSALTSAVACGVAGFAVSRQGAELESIE